MKRFNTLFKLEYSGIFLPLCTLLGLMTALEGFLFAIKLRAAGVSVPFSYIIDTSGIPIVFAAAFVSLLALTILRFAQGYTPSKSIYALLTLPIKREHVYLAKLASSLLAAFCLVSVQLLLLLLFYAVQYIPVVAAWSYLYRDSIRSADLYLALLDSNFLRILFPPDLFSVIFSVFGLSGAVCLSLSASVQVKAGRVWPAAITTAVWLLLILVTFPLSDYKLWHSLIKLALFIVFPFSVSISGIRVFRSGEVAA